jgi:hypothetical protein
MRERPVAAVEKQAVEGRDQLIERLFQVHEATLQEALRRVSGHDQIPSRDVVSLALALSKTWLRTVLQASNISDKEYDEWRHRRGMV